MSADELAERRERAKRRRSRPIRIEELPLFGPVADVERILVAVDELDPTDVDPELVRQTEELPLGWGEEADR